MKLIFFLKRNTRHMVTNEEEKDLFKIVAMIFLELFKFLVPNI